LKRFGYLLFTLALLTSACGGTSEPASDEGEGIAALEGNDAGADGASVDGGTKAGKTKAKGGAGKSATKKQAGTSSSSRGVGASTTTSRRPAATTGGAPGGAQPAVPVPDGTHSYDTDGQTTVSGNKRDMPETTTLTAQPPRGEEQTQIRDLRDDDGNGTVIETRLVYRKEGVYITYVKITATFPGGLTDVRELRPRQPELIAPTGAGPGSSASFVMTGSGTKADVSIRALRFDKIAIGGSSVNALIVGTKIVFSGALEGEQNSTSWVWGRHILALKEQVSTDVTNGPIRLQSDYEAVLTKLP
jgi:hypothetical protein